MRIHSYIVLALQNLLKKQELVSNKCDRNLLIVFFGIGSIWIEKKQEPKKLWLTFGEHVI